ncbi:MAG: alpha/beta hydrolase family protein [Streptosporangiaceae bacterium]
MRRAGWFGAGAVAALSGLAATIAPGGRTSAPAGADDGAVVVGERRRSRRMLDLTVHSPVIEQKQHVRLLLPPGWSPAADRTWPVLWLLHGEMDDYTAWTENTDLAELTEGKELIVVMPDGGGCVSYTDWWNRGDAGKPKWETFHLTELRQILERGYRAGSGRCVAGNSMGGLGAMSYAARHRGMFRSAASFSGALHTLYENEAGLDAVDLHRLVTEVGCPGLDWRRIRGHPYAQRPIWRQHNPFDLAAQLSNVGLYISAGSGRPGPLDALPRDDDVVEALMSTVGLMFAGKLSKRGIPAVTHFYDGSHGWPYWERELHAALPVLLDALDQ